MQVLLKCLESAKKRLVSGLVTFRFGSFIAPLPLILGLFGMSKGSQSAIAAAQVSGSGSPSIVGIEAIYVDESTESIAESGIVDLANLQALRLTFDFAEPIQGAVPQIYTRWRVEDAEGHPITSYPQGGWNPRFEALPLRRVPNYATGMGWLRTTTLPKLKEEIAKRCCKYKALLNEEEEMYQVPISVFDCEEAQYLIGAAPK